jgi:ParB family chromosome partitioning protein
MTKKPAPRHLGRGLESLLGPITSPPTGLSQPSSSPIDSSNFAPDKELHNSLRHIGLKDISPNPHQPRTVWDQQQLVELADSIKSNGLIQPVIVRPNGQGYQLIAGERRFRAAQLAGLDAIPALVRQASDEELLELALVENIHRADLNPIERAKAYRKYLTTFSLTQADAAERLGENRSVVANYLRLLDLPEEIKVMLAEGQLSMGHARAILALPTDELRRKLANRAMAGRLSVREVERLVRQYIEPANQTVKPPRGKAPHIIDLEQKLASHLGTKVAIDTRKNGQRGKISIEFYSLDEFDRIAQRIGLICGEQE